MALVLFTYQLYIAKYYPTAYTGTAPDVKTDERAKEITLENANISEEAHEELVEIREDKEPALPLKDVIVSTEKYIVTLSNEGGCIKSIVLKEYPHSAAGEIFKLVDIADQEQCIFNMTGLDERNLSKIRYVTNEKDREVIFSTQLKNGLEITKRYVFPNASYHIELELYLHNPTEKALPAAYAIVASSNIDIATKLDRRYTQIVSDISGKARRDNGKKGEGTFIEGVVKYTGLQNKYFSVIAKPSMPTSGAWLKQTEKDNLLSNIEISKFTIYPNTGATHNFLLYAGPTRKDIMDGYDLRSAVSYGFFGGIGDMLLASLKFFHRIFKNWGIAVILLSSFVNLILFPLSRKSYESMKKLQELQPHMEKLRDEHKENPQKLNKEIMELYKKYNVNPMGGCLPILLQMPIFIALYQALMRSLDLRGARFLWIRDLSMPDSIRVPFSIPMIGNSINILPILMAGSMVFQQKLATQKSKVENAQAKQQQQMMIMMPILFLFIMYNFPSGLVLYWLTSTLLTMFGQRAIMRS